MHTLLLLCCLNYVDVCIAFLCIHSLYVQNNFTSILVAFYVYIALIYIVSDVYLGPDLCSQSGSFSRPSFDGEAPH